MKDQSSPMLIIIACLVFVVGGLLLVDPNIAGDSWRSRGETLYTLTRTFGFVILYFSGLVLSSISITGKSSQSTSVILIDVLVGLTCLILVISGSVGFFTETSYGLFKNKHISGALLQIELLCSIIGVFLFAYYLFQRNKFIEWLYDDKN